ncbi:MAG: twin-arginine translocase subunit TatC [Myxococcales bacterium]|nr:twin-arginine translocase subunit TatC [Myxococcales bacterium]
MSQEKVMTFTEHLRELRTRLKYCVIALILATLVAYLFSDILFVLLAQPLVRAWADAGLGPPKMHFANPIEPFFTYLKISLVGGIFAASPVVFYQLWKFVAPGLYENEKKYAIPFAAVSAIMFIGGAAFGYFIVFPYGFQFFLSFAKDNMGSMQKLLGGLVNVSVGKPFELRPTLMMGEYFGLVWRLLLAFGVVFELPLVIVFLSMVGLVNHKMLWRFNRYFIVIAFIISALLTPPDVLTQLMMSGPLIVLYNLSILLAWFFHKRREQRLAAMAATTAEGAPEDEATVIDDRGDER